MSKVALITGCAGGIGKATAELFLENGYKVYGLDLFENPEVIGWDILKTDVSSEEQVIKAFSIISPFTDHIDVLVNNAAISTPGRLVETTPLQWDKVLNTNLKSVYLMTKSAYPLLKSSESGAIVNVGSVHAVGTSSGMAAYAASKGGVVALTRAMALEMAEDNIRVNCVLPGAVDTPMLRVGCARDDLGENNLEDNMAQLAENTPLRKIGAPEEIAQSILFLGMSERSSFITGQTLVADGGALARLSTE